MYRAVEESGAPIVSIAGGEPTLHPEIDEIVARIVAQKRFVYLCTNALLMERVMKRIPASKYFAFVVHLDGMEEAHDASVYRKGVFKIAVRAIKAGIEQGYRVTTNTTVFNGSVEEDLVSMFEMLTEMGIEGCNVSPGYQFDSVPNQELFISRKNARRVFKNVLDPKRKIRFYNNPLYLEFLRGNRDSQCTAWSNPTYTTMGWREPCYLIGDKLHAVGQRLAVRRAVGALWRWEGPALRQLHDALRLRVSIDIRSAQESVGRVQAA